MLKLRHNSGKCSARAGRAFTIVELLVVVGVIALILTIAVPGLGGMLQQVRQDAALRNVSSLMSRAYFTAAADANPTAVRVMPGKWDFSAIAEPNQASDRQHLVLYSMRGEYRDFNSGALRAPGMLNSGYIQYFARTPGADALILPADVWAAPVETTASAVANNPYGDVFAQGALEGRLDTFGRNPESDTDFMDSEDFLLVFDPDAGLRSSPGWLAGRAPRYTIKTYDPNQVVSAGERIGTGTVSNRANQYTRAAFSGVALYSRTAYRALDQSGNRPARWQDRHSWLQRNSRPYFVGRQGGGLIEATARGIE